MNVRQKITVSSAGFLAVLFMLLFWLLPSHTARFGVLTEESKAWSDVLKAAQSIQKVQTAWGGSYAWGVLSPDQARVFVESNRVLLASVRTGLQKELFVAVEASEEWLLAHSDEMAAVKVLVYALLTEGKVAEADGRNDKAVAIYLDALTLSYRVVQGGIRLDYLCGISYKALVLRALEEVAPKLTTEQCERVVLTLDRLEKEQEPVRSIAIRERAWRKKVFGLKIRDTISAMVKTRSWYPELIPSSRASFDQRLSSFRKQLIDKIETNSSP